MTDRTKSDSTRTRVRPDCATCRKNPAAWLATHLREPDAPWPVCGRCREQAESLSALVSHEPLEAP